MKFILLSVFILSCSLVADIALAENSTCIVNPVNNIMLLESEVTLEGTLDLNPMFSSPEDISSMTEDQKSVMFLLKPNQSVLLEQWSDTVDVLACQAPGVTLELNIQQRDLVSPALAKVDRRVSVTGKIRWSESSLEIAGNAVLMGVTEISIKK